MVSPMEREQAASNNLCSSWDGMLSLLVLRFTSMNSSGRTPILVTSLIAFSKDTKKRCLMVILISMLGLHNGLELKDPTKFPLIIQKMQVLSRASILSKDSVNLEMKFIDNNQ